MHTLRKTPISEADMQRLTYENMQPSASVTEVKGPHLHAWSYGRDMVHVSPWINFDFRETSGKQRPGWKAHVSVDVAQVAAAWDAILPIVAAHGMNAKVMSDSIEDTLGDFRNKQAGKTIVLYGPDLPQDQELPFWKGLLEAVEDALATTGIRPGWTVKGDFPITGSAYSGVRHDRDPSGRYSHGIDAFDPYGYPGPFDAVVLSPRQTPEPCGDTVTRCLRLLGFVHMGWRHDGVGASVEARNRVVAGDLYRSLVATGLPARVEGTAVSLDWLDEEAIRKSWHGAMEILRCAEFGRVIQDRGHGELETMTITRRQALHLPPRARFAITDPDLLVSLHQALASIPGLGECVPTMDGSSLVVPYAGRYHTEEGFDPHWHASIVRAVDESFLSRVASPSP